jgi:hypothetical protein
MSTPEPPNQLSSAKRRVFALVVAVLTLLLLLPTAEIIARLRGFQPYSVKQAEIVVEPGGRFFKADPDLGYSHLPGRFRVTLAGEYTFTATNLDDTLRITHPLESYQNSSKKPEIWIMGDSITYGWSVSDDEAYPWLLQQRFPDYEVVNFGVSGYGTLHSLIQLKAALASGRKPKLVVLAYAAWHDVRNTFIRIRRKMLAPSSYLGPLNQPYAKLADDGSLQISMDTIEYREFPLMRYSAFMNMIEERYDGYEERHARSHDVTKAIFREMYDLCHSNSVEFVVVDLTDDPITQDMAEYCQSLGIKTGSIYVDMNIKENKNLPYDSHPSALAHRQYAQKLGDLIRPDL